MKSAGLLHLNRSTARRERMRSLAMEHFGLEIGKSARRTLISKVQSGKVKFSRKLTHSRTVVVAEYSGMEVTFIYCGTAKSILTFLPADARETAGWREAQVALSSCRESIPMNGEAEAAILEPVMNL